MPESPSWLLQKGQKERARKALRYFRGLNVNDNGNCASIGDLCVY